MGPYDAVLTFTTVEEANQFLKKDIAAIRALTCTVVALHQDEAERISKKNCVAFAFDHSEEAGKLAESLFGIKNPYE